MATRRSREANNVAIAERFCAISSSTFSNTLEMSDGDAALTDTHTGRVHVNARAALCSSCPRFRERMSASVLPIWSADLKGLQEVVMNRSIAVVIAGLVIIGAG